MSDIPVVILGVFIGVGLFALFVAVICEKD